MNGRTADDPCDCKVGRAMTAYDLYGLDDELRRRRLEEDETLRQLTDYVNCRILKRAIEGTAPDLLEPDTATGVFTDVDTLDAIYEVLASDENAAQSARVKTRLEQAGVQVGAVEDDWVTHPTIRTHLRECLDISTSTSTDLDTDGAISTIGWARRRCAGVAESTLDRLRTAGLLDAPALDVTVSIRTTCSACDRSYRPNELIRRGHCDCRSDGESGT